MTNFDELVNRCLAAVTEHDPRRALREALQQVLAQGLLADAIDHPTPGLTVLHHAPDLTVLNVVWPPHFSIFPHDHRMWAAIAIYSGREDNTFFRRSGRRIAPSGGKQLEEGDVALLGADTIHAVTNPTRSYTGAIHVYGGNFIDTPRSQWDSVTSEEQPYDLAAVRRAFDNAELEASER